MSRRTETKARRAQYEKGRVNGLGTQFYKIVGYLPAQPRNPMKCNGCGRTMLLSVGQAQRCWHGKNLTKSRRKEIKLV